MARIETLDGLYPAVVTSNGDPLDMGRIKVVFPWMDNGVESNWARLVQPYAGRLRGMFFMPEVGDEVMVCFEHGDFNQPLVIGATWNGEDDPPEPNDPAGENHDKVIETRSGHRLIFNDTPGQEYIQLSDGSLNNIVRWDSLSNTLTVNAKTGDIIIRSSRTMNLDSRELFVRVTDSASMKVGKDHKVTVKDYATERQSNSKQWSALASLTAKANKFDVKSTVTFKAGGAKAKLDITQQSSNATVIEGETRESTNILRVKADEIYERADRRDWHIAESNIEAQAVIFDTSGPMDHSAGKMNIRAGGGELSFRGGVVTTEAGLIKLGGGLDMQPAASVPTRQGEGQGGLGPKPNWVEFVVSDASGLPLPYVAIELTLPDGRVEAQTTDKNGLVRCGNIPEGQIKIRVKKRFPG